MKETSVQYQLAVQKEGASQNAHINFAIPFAAHVILRVTNRDDEEVRLLLNEPMHEGAHSVLLNFNHLPSAGYRVILIVETDKAIDKQTHILEL